MYPAAMQISVQPGPLGEALEGASRPGHFAGVLTVVTKLFNILAPDSSHFGQKDYQQLTAVRLLVRDLNLPIAIVGVPTVRDDDGLALSSRNTRLSIEGRRRAAAIPQALNAVQLSLESGATVQQALDDAHAALHREGIIDIDYIVVTGPDLDPLPSSGPARVLIAATVDGVRLLDNKEVVI
jgi:pantoate--beta-alanine ligase